ncbi:MAG: MurR/RpiR family transcriptional regulator [Limnochordia bacterium]|jgi:RpiR family carbohydrate utilization transcriptional regulator
MIPIEDTRRNNAANPESALLLKIRSLLPSLSTTQKRIAAYILEHPREVVYLSVTEFADRCNVGNATIVRFCQLLGMEGYQELKVALAQDVVSPIETIHEAVTENDSDIEILNKVFHATMHTLEYTLRIINPKQFERAVEALSSASRINIYGCGNSAAIAIDLQHKLLRLGMNAAAYNDSHMQCIASTLLKPGDVCVAISHSGSSIDIVDAATLAKDFGATVICMTNIGRSPLSDVSDIRLDTASKETEYHIVALSSRISQYTIIDSLYTALAVRNLQNLQQEERLHIIEKSLSRKKY